MTCFACGFYDEDYGCTCPSLDRWYACPLEPEPKPEDFMTEENCMKVVLDDGAYMPEKAHRADAGYDLRTPKRVVLRRGESVCIDTGVHIAIPDGWYGKLESKSGLNVKHSIVSLGGVIDSSYTGSIVVKLYNFGNEDYAFEVGDKVIQIVFMKCGSFSMTQVDELEDTDRGDNGFGSSGK